MLADICLALASVGMTQAQQRNSVGTKSNVPLAANGFDCSKIHELGIDKQMNFRAGAIMIV